ncbi:MAG: hypothetical protein EXR69_08295 [Myxococcales bacterium]|nr:hypothetical protein [Myxococcales bacterium]
MTQRENFALRAAVAFVWLATGLLVASPTYRQIGSGLLLELRLPAALMPITCLAEVVLGLRVLLGPPSRWLAALQIGMMAVFTTILAVHDPMLLVNPFGMLTKNLPIVACVLAATLGAEEGWSQRVVWVLRVGSALPWFTEGLFPKILFPQDIEIAVVAASPLSFGDPHHLLQGLGLLQIVAFACALTLRGRWLRACLLVQAGALLVLPVLVGMELPDLWVHPFGPLTKNVPLLTGTLLLARRCSS